MSEQIFYPPNHPYFIAREDTPENLFYYYLKCCVDYVQHKYGYLHFDYTVPNDINNGIIRKLWNDGSHVIPKAFYYERFWKIIHNGYPAKGETIQDFKPISKSKTKYKWYDNSYSSKYQKKPHHKKKDIEPSQKEIWRQYTGHYRNTSKAYCHDRGHFMKKHQQRKLRQWTKQNIYKQNWDVFHSKQVEKMFFEPWVWD